MGIAHIIYSNSVAVFEPRDFNLAYFGIPETSIKAVISSGVLVCLIIFPAKVSSILHKKSAAVPK